MKERYLHSVRILMDCPSREKEHLLSRLSNAITVYLGDVPEASESDIVSNFGTPEECAARLLDECTPAALATERQKKSRSHRTFMTVLAVLLAVALGFVMYLWSNGGLVIIQTNDRAPTFWNDYPPEHIIYSYDE